MSVRDVIIIGAGPSGLSAAIAAKRRGLDYQVIEQGVLVNSIYRFPPQMVFFTTPELLEIGRLPFASPYEKPTRPEALNYYRKVVDTYDLQISLDETVLSIERDDAIAEVETGTATGTGAPAAMPRLEAEASAPVRAGGGAPAPLKEMTAGTQNTFFTLETRTPHGVRRARHARFVILATGYYDRPVMLNVPGEGLPHVRHFYTEPHPYYRRRVVVVGGANSAAEAALELYRAGASVTLVHRRPELKSTIKYWVRPDIENRFKEGSIAVRFNSCVQEIRQTSIVISTRTPESDAETIEEIPADAVLLLVGYRANTDLFVRAGVTLTDREAPTYDVDTFETNVPGLFVAGGALAGVDTGTVFIENGRFHGEKILEVIAQRMNDA